MLTKEETEFCRLVIEKSFVTREQVTECLSARQVMAELGVSKDISEIMLRKNYLSIAQIKEVLKQQGRERLQMWIGPYELLDKLGQGNMGAVYLGYNKTIDRKVAIKILAPWLAKDEKYLDRFQKEARTAARLNHPNIVRGIDVGEEGGYHYFVMELIEGPNCEDMVKSKGPFPEAKAIEIVSQMAQALQSAFENGLVHRDVKPANIMLDKTGAAKLTDLGLATGFDANAKPGAKIAGTPNYISPEQIKSSFGLDIRSDLYSLGATFFFLLTGRPPYAGTTPQEILRKHLNEPIPDPRQIKQDISEKIVHVVQKLLAKDPAKRYQDGRALARDLMETKNPALDKTAISEIPLAPPPEEEAPPAAHPSRRKSSTQLKLGRTGRVKIEKAEGEEEDVAERASRPKKPPIPRMVIAVIVIFGLALVALGVMLFVKPVPVPDNATPTPTATGSPDQPTPPEEDTSSADAAESLAKAEAYKEKYPNDKLKIMGRYLDVVKNHPGTEAARDAATKADELKKILIAKGSSDVRKLAKELEAEIQKGEYGAISKLEQAVKEYSKYKEFEEVIEIYDKEKKRLEIVAEECQLEASVAERVKEIQALIADRKLDEAEGAVTTSLVKFSGHGSLMQLHQEIVTARETIRREQFTTLLTEVKDLCRVARFKEALAKARSAEDRSPEELATLISRMDGAQTIVNRMSLKIGGDFLRAVTFEGKPVKLIKADPQTIEVSMAGAVRKIEWRPGDPLDALKWQIISQLSKDFLADDLANVGAMFLLLGDEEKAKLYIKRAQEKDRNNAHIEDIAADLGMSQIKVYITITTSPEGIPVFVNDQNQGPSPVRKKADANKPMTVFVSAPGYLPQNISFSPSSDKATLNVDLAKIQECSGFDGMALFVTNGFGKHCMDIFEYPNKANSMPMVNVSWLKAQELCRAQNKSLCNATVWQDFCWGEKSTDYPYGNIYDPDACNTGKKQLAPAGTFPRCVSMYGIYDMSGNASEWVDQGYASNEPTAYGGSVFSKKATCKDRNTQSDPNARFRDIGFRCCVELKEEVQATPEPTPVDKKSDDGKDKKPEGEKDKKPEGDKPAGEAKAPADGKKVDDKKDKDDDDDDDDENGAEEKPAPDKKPASDKKPADPKKEAAPKDDKK